MGIRSRAGSGRRRRDVRFEKRGTFHSSRWPHGNRTINCVVTSRTTRIDGAARSIVSLNKGANSGGMKRGKSVSSVTSAYIFQDRAELLLPGDVAGDIGAAAVQQSRGGQHLLGSSSVSWCVRASARKSSRGNAVRGQLHV